MGMPKPSTSKQGFPKRGPAGPPGAGGGGGSLPSGTGLVGVTAGSGETITVGAGLNLTGSFGARTLSAGWTPVYSVDFSALATGVTPGADGAVTIDGKTWYAKNVANVAEMRTVNGEGLVIDPSAVSSDLYGPTYTAPTWAIKWSDLGIPPDSDYRIWLKFATTGIASDFETADFAIEQFQTTTYRIALARLFSTGSGGQCWQVRRTLAGGTSTPASGTDNPSHDVVLISGRGQGITSILTGASVGGNFPDQASLTLRQLAVVDFSGGNPAILHSTNNLAFAFACYPVNTSNSLRASISKFLVEKR